MTAPDSTLHTFTALSAHLTGFDTETLEGTDLTTTYRTVTHRQLGPDRFARLLDAWHEDPEAARSLTLLWYTGTWPGPPPFVVSPHAYAQALVWKAAGLTAPATTPTTHGSWSVRPPETSPR
ncbi:hypothetical protein LG634_17105 [Streptomyces bambusae]|uniref:hypothetical protein n=1 Tax=Streptomyces bambusae TaxID=1550616 RepID=UPI001CFE11E3|nr:hypothetical protein [Streptomyces bambusae]MCB5166549.1 hypothetical protein [Streptomyces bambusae]